MSGLFRIRSLRRWRAWVTNGRSDSVAAGTYSWGTQAGIEPLCEVTMVDSAGLWKDVVAIRAGGPLVHNVTNLVVMDFTAKALLTRPEHQAARAEFDGRLAGAPGERRNPQALRLLGQFEAALRINPDLQLV